MAKRETIPEMIARHRHEIAAAEARLSEERERINVQIMAIPGNRQTRRQKEGDVDLRRGHPPDARPARILALLTQEPRGLTKKQIEAILDINHSASLSVALAVLHRAREIIWTHGVYRLPTAATADLAQAAE